MLRLLVVSEMAMILLAVEIWFDSPLFLPEADATSKRQFPAADEVIRGVSSGRAKYHWASEASSRNVASRPGPPVFASQIRGLEPSFTFDRVFPAGLQFSLLEG